MTHTVVVYNGVDAFTKAATVLQDFFQQNLDNPILFLTSGGGALKILSVIDSSGFNNRITLGVVDERFSTDPSINTFFQFSKTDFFKRAVEHGCGYISTFPKERETKEMMALRFEKSLRLWRSAHTDGKICITLGIGADGHTAGMMPYPENPKMFADLFEQKSWVTAYDALGKNDYPLRVTTTCTFLKLVDFAVVYAEGQEKEATMRKVLLSQDSVASVPARIIYQMKRVDLFTPLAI